MASSETKGLFANSASEKRIARILDRAVAKSIAKSKRGMKAKSIGIKTPRSGGSGGSGGRGKRARKSSMDKALAKAMSTIGAAISGRPSIRAKAKDTGGRSFHFQYYCVSKADAGVSSSGGTGTRKGSAAAHHAYIEREMALEALYEPEGPEVSRERGGDPTVILTADRGRHTETRPGHQTEFERDLGIDRGFSPDPLSQARSTINSEHEIDLQSVEVAAGRASAAQAYIENPAKMRNGELILSSFGTIGDTFQERIDFWNLLEEHEWSPKARIQNRIICELPHQSTPEARREILRRFTASFDEKGLPYHVAIHAPGKDNDSRNYHAHVVFSERPAKKTIDPETGIEQWDFAITKTYKTSSRHTKTSHPYRQDRLRDFAARDYLINKRKGFAEIVTEVMKPIDSSVIFDPRSYKNMGLDIAPMKTISRFTRDRMKKGKIVVQDSEWTKKMIEAEISAAAQRRDADMQMLMEVSRKMAEMKKTWPNLQKVNANLARGSILQRAHGFTKQTFANLLDARFAIEHERILERIVAKAEAEVCRKVIEQTTPTKATLADRSAPFTKEEREAHAFINAAAREELAEIQANLRAAELRLRNRYATLRDIWQRMRLTQPIAQAPKGKADPSPPKQSQSEATFAPKVHSFDDDGPKKPKRKAPLKTHTKDGKLLWDAVGLVDLHDQTPRPEEPVPTHLAQKTGQQAQSRTYAPRAIHNDSVVKESKNKFNGKDFAGEITPLGLTNTPFKTAPAAESARGSSKESRSQPQSRPNQKSEAAKAEAQPQVVISPTGEITYHGFAKTIGEMMSKMVNDAINSGRYLDIVREELAAIKARNQDAESVKSNADAVSQANAQSQSAANPAKAPLQTSAPDLAPSPGQASSKEPDVTKSPNLAQSVRSESVATHEKPAAEPVRAEPAAPQPAQFVPTPPAPEPVQPRRVFFESYEEVPTPAVAAPAISEAKPASRNPQKSESPDRNISGSNSTIGPSIATPNAAPTAGAKPESNPPAPVPQSRPQSSAEPIRSNTPSPGVNSPASSNAPTNPQKNPKSRATPSASTARPSDPKAETGSRPNTVAELKSLIASPGNPIKQPLGPALTYGDVSKINPELHRPRAARKTAATAPAPNTLTPNALTPNAPAPVSPAESGSPTQVPALNPALEPKSTASQFPDHTPNQVTPKDHAVESEIQTPPDPTDADAAKKKARRRAIVARNPRGGQGR